MRQSAGILLYKIDDGELRFFLVHPGGPFWKNKDVGAWSIPKGEFEPDENPLDAAIREFAEETGTRLQGAFEKLTAVKLKSGKTVHAWAIAGDINADAIKSNPITIEWPPKSGKQLSIPEVDKGGWFTVSESLEKINAAQAAFVVEASRKFGQ